MEDTTNDSVEKHSCSSCNQVIKKEAEICPHCGVRQIPLSQVMANSNTSDTNDKQLSIKFFLTSGVTFVIFLALIFSTLSSEEFANGAIGSFIFALVAGLIAMAIPSTKKIIYIPTSVAIMFLTAFLIGVATQ